MWPAEPPQADRPRPGAARRGSHQLRAVPRVRHAVVLLRHQRERADDGESTRRAAPGSSRGSRSRPGAPPAERPGTCRRRRCPAASRTPGTCGSAACSPGPSVPQSVVRVLFHGRAAGSCPDRRAGPAAAGASAAPPPAGRTRARCRPRRAPGTLEPLAESRRGGRRWPSATRRFARSASWTTCGSRCATAHGSLRASGYRWTPRPTRCPRSSRPCPTASATGWSPGTSSSTRTGRHAATPASGWTCAAAASRTACWRTSTTRRSRTTCSRSSPGSPPSHGAPAASA